MTVYLLSSDLMLLSQVSGAANQRGARLVQVGHASALLTQAATIPAAGVLIEVSQPGLDLGKVISDLKNLPQPPGFVIGFGPHVQQACLDRAREAGCNLVLTRGQFVSSLSVLLEEFLPRNA